MSRWGRVLLGLLAVGLLLGGRFASDRARDVRSERSMDDVAYLPTSEALRLISFGYDAMTADFLWLRTVTYYGAWRHGDHGIEFFRELSHRVVDLDPHFVDAYRFGAMVLADDLERFDEAMELLRKGMRAMPDDWELPFEAGFLEYTVRLDDEKAARWFTIAARKPGAPDMAGRFAAFVTSRAGDLEKSYVLWQFVAETSDNPDVRKKALEYMTELELAIKGEGPIPEWAKRRRVVNGRGVEGDV